MIEFEIPEVTMQILKNRRAFNLEVVRKICQYYDEYENEHAEMKAEEREKFVKENQSQAGQDVAGGQAFTQGYLFDKHDVG